MRSRYLSLYLAAIVVWQEVIYTGFAFGPESVYFDPRIGFELLRSPGGIHANPALFQWLSAIVLLLLAGAILVRERAIILYWVIEPLLALPTLIFFLGVLWANMSPAHGFSVAELTIPVIVFVICTVVPWTWAMVLFRSRRRRVVF